MSRLISRAFVTTAAASSLALAALAGSATVSAHVHVESDDPIRGDTALITFQVPNESDAGSPTTELSVSLPHLTSVSTAVTPGWEIKLDRDAAAGTVRSVTWSAAPNSGIPADQFALFVMRVKLPDAETVSFPATQTYADGTVVRWDQPPPPGGGEPEHPAPMLTLTATGDAHAEDHALAAATPSVVAPTPAGVAATAQSSRGTDNVARVLAGGALLIAALGIVIALVRRRA